ncbi:uncharacterized protein LOC127837089 [Dreissena polymorpha]|uniref:VWFA domain-containing protein n=1 Tax=Dreissena polymorpha TaxID=45954 RepID=A0A9D4RWV9_DREPO|nr:uncharacterized protein LOC127837089 [Dreissena polymorpha]XP_052219896.1 uncharacterized protein LOC127837089 [Dreissena polymorpha]KAH3884401.1 hypothetical protein DPMN_008379 [Dreissena polymorpha]
MSLIASLAYVIAILIGLLLYYSYQKRDKQEMAPSASVLRRRKRLQKHYSLFAALGLERNNNHQNNFSAIEDQFTSFSQVSNACSKAGLERCGLIVGVDFTASNEWQGRKTFRGHCLHRIDGEKIYNPYQKVINIIGNTLEPFDEDNLIPAYGFGDTETIDTKVFPFNSDESPCKGFKDVLDRYNDIAKRVQLSGPTNFAPLIHKAIELVKAEKIYHILLIIADGQVNEEDPTIDAIVEASNYPLSIVVIGVGDGPWETMDDFDNLLPKRKFDNFQFVNYHQVASKSRKPETAIALHALMEIPDQYKTIKAMGYLNKGKLETPL